MNTVKNQPVRILPSTVSPHYAEVRDKAALVLDAPDEWMATPNTRLGLKRPDQVVAQYGDAGKEAVLRVLDSIQEGIFT